MLASTRPSAALQKTGLQHRHDRHEHVSHVVNDKIEPITRKPGKVALDLRHPGKGAVKTINDDRQSQPAEYRHPGTGKNSPNCHEAANNAHGGKEMDQSRRPHGCLPIRAAADMKRSAQGAPS